MVSIFAIIAIWKDFLWPLLVLQDTEKQTLSVALSRLARAEELGISYREYALEIMERGRYL